VKIVYSKRYEIKFEHVWPLQKYSAVLEALLKHELIKPDDVIYVDKAADEDVRLVHTSEYVRKLQQLSLSEREIATLEIPLTSQTVDFFWTFAQGTITACELAVKEGFCVHLGGGMHHAFTNYGSGFCMLNDVAIGLRKTQHQGLIKRAMVIDCDVHQGDGTAVIFQTDDSVFTFSIHQRDNFPYFKQKSNMDIELDDKADDQVYLRHLKEKIPAIIGSFRPDLIVYVAGADVYKFDLLGGLDLSIAGVEKRDRFIIRQAAENNIPLAVTLAGGYAVNPDDTAAIHLNTVKACLQV